MVINKKHDQAIKTLLNGACPTNCLAFYITDYSKLDTRTLHFFAQDRGYSIVEGSDGLGEVIRTSF